MIPSEFYSKIYLTAKKGKQKCLCLNVLTFKEIQELEQKGFSVIRDISYAPKYIIISWEKAIIHRNVRELYPFDSSLLPAQQAWLMSYCFETTLALSY